MYTTTLSVDKNPKCPNSASSLCFPVLSKYQWYLVHWMLKMDQLYLVGTIWKVFWGMFSDMETYNSASWYRGEGGWSIHPFSMTAYPALRVTGVPEPNTAEQPRGWRRCNTLDKPPGPQANARDKSNSVIVCHNFFRCSNVFPSPCCTFTTFCVTLEEKRKTHADIKWNFPMLSPSICSEKKNCKMGSISFIFKQAHQYNHYQSICNT